MERSAPAFRRKLAKEWRESKLCANAGPTEIADSKGRDEGPAMKAAIIPGCVVLSVQCAAPGAHASGHSTFFECGQYRMISIYVSTPGPKSDDYFWELVSNYDDNNPKRIPLHMIKRKGGTFQVVATNGSGQPVKMFIPNYYYRGQKCEEISRSQAIEKAMTKLLLTGIAALFLAPMYWAVVL